MKGPPSALTKIKSELTQQKQLIVQEAKEIHLRRNGKKQTMQESYLFGKFDGLAYAISAINEQLQ